LGIIKLNFCHEANIRGYGLRFKTFFRNALLFVIFVVLISASAKTRWSALHLVPDADFIPGGQYVADVDAYYYNDSSKGSSIRPSSLVNAGIIDWINVETGYAGGFTLGLKARIFGETGYYMPSVAIGARNIVSHKEVNYFSGKDTIGDEFYVAFAKSLESLRMRFHCGIQTIPVSKNDKFDPFFALEKYFGKGFYGTFEVESWKGNYLPSIFASWRLFNKKLEISGGAVAVNRVFFDKNNKLNFSLTSTKSDGAIRPGIWFGLRYCGIFDKEKKTFQSVEDRLDIQHDAIASMRIEIDSLKKIVSQNSARTAKIDNSLAKLNDSVFSDKNSLKKAILEKLTALKSIYESEPFDPEQARKAIAQIVALKDTAMPALKEFVIDKKQDRRIRILSISLIGEMSGAGALDALLDVLNQTEDSGIKIEILISLGKMKETRAIYVMEQFSNDPEDAVAFTAQEVLMRLVREKGIRLSPDFKMRHVAMPESNPVNDEKIPVVKLGGAGQSATKDTASKRTVNAGQTGNESKLLSDNHKSEDIWGINGLDSNSHNSMKSDTVKSNNDVEIKKETVAIENSGKGNKNRNNDATKENVLDKKSNNSNW
jgi:hypothetical protein